MDHGLSVEFASRVSVLEGCELEGEASFRRGAEGEAAVFGVFPESAKGASAA